MSDYLSDLVTKNIGTADVIEPRRPARFEPLRTGMLEIEPSLQTEIFEEEQTIESIPPARPRRRETRETEKIDTDAPEEQAPVAAPPEIHLSEIEKSETRVTLTPKINEPPQESSVESAARHEPKPQASLTPVAPLEPPVQLVEKHEISSNVIEPAPVEPRRAPESEADGSKISSEKIFETKIVEPAAPVVIEPRVEKIENRIEDTTIQQTVIPLLREPASKQISERAEMRETPVINVTIGRVEVRAAVSSAPPKQAAAKPPTLSLDEYLKKRNNGGRK